MKLEKSNIKVEEIISKDLNVKKYVFYFDNSVAESVLYKYESYEKRTVICCSTQSGCPVGCRFCGAGENFVRSLTSGEIVKQVEYLLDSNNIEHGSIEKFQIMFMSMGEPFLNYKELKESILVLNKKYKNAKLLISTTAPKINYDDFFELSKNIDQIGLQFSIHEIEEDKRNALIPFKRKLTIDEISELGTRWFLYTGRKPFFNYCAHEKNTEEKHAKMLHEKLSPNVFNATVSVICEKSESVSAANERQRALATNFMPKLVNEGYDVRCFDPAGQDDIGGGCGQLWFVQKWMKENRHLTVNSVGHGLPSVHCPK